MSTETAAAPGRISRQRISVILKAGGHQSGRTPYGSRKGYVINEHTGGAWRVELIFTGFRGRSEEEERAALEPHKQTLEAAGAVTEWGRSPYPLFAAEADRNICLIVTGYNPPVKPKGGAK